MAFKKSWCKSSSTARYASKAGSPKSSFQIPDSETSHVENPSVLIDSDWGTSRRTRVSRTIERPEWRPENGLTVSVESLAVTAVSLVATPAGDRPIEIHLADCFGRDDAAFSLADRALIESAIADAMDRKGRLSVTFPMPAQPQSWWHNLKLKEGAFAAYVWLDDTTTLQQLLCKTGRYRPSQPQQSAVVYRDKPAPQSRPCMV